jgi:hypothetical protein
MKNEKEEAQKSQHNLHIEKYLNEAYFLKCERDELKIQLTNLKKLLDDKENELEKQKSKSEKYRIKNNELECIILNYEIQLRKYEAKFEGNSYDEPQNVLFLTEIEDLKLNINKLSEENFILNKRLEQIEKIEKENKPISDQTICNFETQ